jgi:hypothetical protein
LFVFEEMNNTKKPKGKASQQPPEPISSTILKSFNTFGVLQDHTFHDDDDQESTSESAFKNISFSDNISEIKGLSQQLLSRLESLERQMSQVETSSKLALEENLSTKSKCNHLLEEHYNFKKDVRTLLGLESPNSTSRTDRLSTDSAQDVNFSFRAVIEQISNPLEPLSNHNYEHFMIQYTKWKNYKGRGGFLSLYGYVYKSPTVFNVFLQKAKSTDPSFHFHDLHDDDNFFKQLMEKVFFPTGFDITAFSSLIKSKKMTSFSIQNVSQFAFEISSIITLLSEQIKDLLTPDLWHIVCTFTQPLGFQKFLSRRCPSNRKQFLSTLDSSACLYDQQFIIQQSDLDSAARRQSPET